MTEGSSEGPGRYDLSAADLNDVILAAAMDAAFRQALLADPRRAIEDKFGTVLPAGMRLRFLEREPDVDLLIVLPDLLDLTAELSADHLEQAGGGARTPTVEYRITFDGSPRVAIPHARYT